MSSANRITIKDIAQKLGISHTTVSLALKNHHRISLKRRAHVQRVAKEMGYSPDPFLVGLAAYRWKNTRLKYQGTLAWVRHWTMEDYRHKFKYHEELWHGASRTAREAGYQLEEFCWSREFTAKRFEQILLTRGIQGILIPPHRPAPDWGGFDWNKFSVVRFGLSVPSPDSNLVTADSFRGTVLAVNKIHEYNYRRIGLVLGVFDNSLGANVRGGFLAAQSCLGLSPAIPPLVTGGDLFSQNSERENKRLKQWLERYRPEAILTTEAQLLTQLRRLGWRIPKDVAVAATSVHDIGIDAGIDQHGEAIGQVAVEMLVKQINVNERGEPKEPCRILVESRWQNGKSLPNKSAK
jgi:LacI family transcriptional regulator, galactose operon repressor